MPAGATVVYSAHGVAPTVHTNSARLGHNVIDATCPLVTKVHVQARRYASEGYTIVLIGHAGHEEVVGTTGEAPDATVLVQTVEEAEALTMPADAKLAYVTQTTLSVDETGEIIKTLRRRFPEIRAPRKEDICYATSNRQWAVKEMLSEIDLCPRHWLRVEAQLETGSWRRRGRAGDPRLSHRRRDGDRRRVDRGRRDRRHHVRGVGAREAREPGVRLVQRPRGNRDRAVHAHEDVTFRLPIELRRELELAARARSGPCRSRLQPSRCSVGSREARSGTRSASVRRRSPSRPP